jgi:hypothetical protein
MFRAKCKANQELGNRRRVHTPMRRRSTSIVQPRRFDARAGGSERQFRNAVHYRGADRTGRSRGGAVIADHYFACEGNVPLLTVKRRIPVVAARGNVSGFVCWHIGEHSLPTSGTEAVDGEIVVLVMNALWPEPEATVDAGGVRCLGSTCRRSVGPNPPLVTRFRRAAIG